MTDRSKTDAEALLGAWSEQATGYPLAAERHPFIAAELVRYAASLDAAGSPPLAAEPVTTYRGTLVRGARP
ncbi:MAG: hypothetical protein RLT05_37390 [Bauldia litoralis]